MIRTEIEIAAPPSMVRDVVSGNTPSIALLAWEIDDVILQLLDFPRLRDWHSGWLVALESQTPGKTTGHDLLPGEKLIVKTDGMHFPSKITQNTSLHYSWTGTWCSGSVFTGEHHFEFNPSRATPGGTTMIQWENVTGLLFPFLKPSMPSGKNLARGFDKVNADLKAEAEALYQSEQRPNGRK